MFLLIPKISDFELCLFCVVYSVYYFNISLAKNKKILVRTSTIYNKIQNDDLLKLHVQQVLLVYFALLYFQHFSCSTAILRLVLVRLNLFTWGFTWCLWKKLTPFHYKRYHGCHEDFYKVIVFVIQAGPQREIFPGGTKVDAGPPNLFWHQSCTKFYILIFSKKKTKN